MNRSVKPVVLSAAGFDPGSGAGLSADLKTFSALGVYGIGLITCLTSQNHGHFSRNEDVDAETFSDQLETLSTGYQIKCVKTGLMTKETASVIGAWKRDHPDIILISDPVLTATAGNDFFTKEEAVFLESSLYKYADLITPNLHEASILSGIMIKTVEDMVEAGRLLTGETGRAVLIKGGHLEGEAIDVLFNKGYEHYFTHGRISDVNTHGSGCVLSAAITSHIAAGESLTDSVSKAKDFLNGLMKHPVYLEGVGPVIDPSGIRRNI